MDKGRGSIDSAQGLLGRTVVSQSNEPLGRVRDIVLDVPCGKLDYVVIQPSTNLAVEAKVMIPVPAQVLAQTGSPRTLQLKADRDQFLSGPHFEKKFWTEMAMEGFAASVYRHYGVSPHRPEQLAMATERTPKDIEYQFLKELVDQAAMPSTDARKLNIQVRDGRLMISGRAASEKDKEAILNAATRVVGPANVVDHIEVR